jgi:hypothetical protein
MIVSIFHETTKLSNVLFHPGASTISATCKLKLLKFSFDQRISCFIFSHTLTKNTDINFQFKYPGASTIIKKLKFFCSKLVFKSSYCNFHHSTRNCSTNSFLIPFFQRDYKIITKKKNVCMNISHFLQCTGIYILVLEANMYFFLLLIINSMQRGFPIYHIRLIK